MKTKSQFSGHRNSGDEWWEYWGYETAGQTMQVVTDGFVMQPGFVPRREKEYSKKETSKNRKKGR